MVLVLVLGLGLGPVLGPGLSLSLGLGLGLGLGFGLGLGLGLSLGLSLCLGLLVFSCIGLPLCLGSGKDGGVLDDRNRGDLINESMAHFMKIHAPHFERGYRPQVRLAKLFIFMIGHISHIITPVHSMY